MFWGLAWFWNPLGLRVRRQSLLGPSLSVLCLRQEQHRAKPSRLFPWLTCSQETKATLQSSFWPCRMKNLEYHLVQGWGLLGEVFGGLKVSSPDRHKCHALHYSPCKTPWCSAAYGKTDSTRRGRTPKQRSGSATCPPIHTIPYILPY